MVHYIRFLRVPRVTLEEKGATKVISAVLTVTTDLGETFFPEDLELTAYLLDADRSGEAALASWSVLWRKNSRVVKLQVRFKNKFSNISAAQLHISTKNTEVAVRRAQIIPKILDAWSSPFQLVECSAEDFVERRFRIADDNYLKIWEETGESIARHIWDGALGCLELYKELFRTHAVTAWMPKLQHLLRHHENKILNVVELGSGCGFAGIGLAQIKPSCRVLLTDLEEAQEIISRNIKSAVLPKGSSLRQEILDWDLPLSKREIYQNVDLLVVCECIYNADSDPALVGVLQHFIQNSPGIRILVATKRRHFSETVFFELMDEANIQILEQCTIPLPHHISDADSEKQEVEIYLYAGERAGSGAATPTRPKKRARTNSEGPAG